MSSRRKKPAAVSHSIGEGNVDNPSQAEREAEFSQSRLFEKLKWITAPVEDSILIRNSWGRSWGMSGYGWLPMRYISNGLAADVWTIFKESWIHG